jgi:hypothetical protein
MLQCNMPRSIEIKLCLSRNICCGAQIALVESVAFPPIQTFTMNNNAPPRHPVICEFEGQTYKGTSRVAGKLLTAATGGGGRSKQSGTMGPQELARGCCWSWSRRRKPRPAVWMLSTGQWSTAASDPQGSVAALFHSGHAVAPVFSEATMESALSIHATP